MTPDSTDMLTRANIEALFAHHEAERDRQDADFASRVELWGAAKPDPFYFEGTFSGYVSRARSIGYPVGAKVPGKFKRRK